MSAGITADRVIAVMEQALRETHLDESVTARDVFHPVAVEEGLESIERDRVCVVTIVNGPDRLEGSSCQSRIRGAASFRYFREGLSRARMMRDIPIIRAALRRARLLEPSLLRMTVRGPTYEYNRLEQSTVINFFFNADFREVVIR